MSALRRILLAGLLLVALPAATGAADAPAPAGIQSATLVQHGLDLRWSVTLDHSFSGLDFTPGGRSLCLLLNRRRRGVATSELCIAPPRGAGRRLRLRSAKLTASGTATAWHTVPAKITRSSHSELTASFVPTSYTSTHWQVRSATAGGAVLFPAKPRFVALHTPKLVGCVPRGPSLVFHGPTNRREIALAFDDGPWNDPPTIDFVRLLARLHVPATFFEIGDQISEYDPTGAVERKMLADGDMIGDHTWTHPDMTTLSPAAQRSELERTATAIRHATGFTPCLWRPPYGDIDNQLDSLARRLGFLTIYWDIDPRDWSLPGVASIEQTVLDEATNGGIVEMHFGGGPRQETLDALPTIIRKLRHRGYHFVTVAQMLGLKLLYR